MVDYVMCFCSLLLIIVTASGFDSDLKSATRQGGRVKIEDSALPEVQSGSGGNPRSTSTTHLSCDCPEGFFSKGTLSVFTATDICESSGGGGGGDIQRRSMSASPDDADRSSASNVKLIPTSMKICESCTTGCALCLGPDDNDCLKCLPGYLINYYQEISIISADSATSKPANARLSTRKKRTSGGSLGHHHHHHHHHRRTSGGGSLSRRRTSAGSLGRRRTSALDVIYAEEGLLVASTATAASVQIKRKKSKHFKKRLPEMADDSYVDDNFMSFESVDLGSSGFGAERAERGDRFSPLKPITSGSHQLAVAPLNLKQETRNKSGEFDHYGDIEPSFIEETVKLDVPLPVPIPIAATTTKLTDAVIQWHGSAPFSCAATCPKNLYADEDGVCQACHAECNGCKGNGPNHCLECRHFHQDGRGCVSECPFDDADPDMDIINSGLGLSTSFNCSVLFARRSRRRLDGDNDDDAHHEDDDDGQNEIGRIPVAFYILPPLVVLAVVGFVFLGYFRRRYRMQLNLPCTDRGRANRTTNRDHEDHKKCFLNRNKERSSTTDLKLSTSPMHNRQGNAYVYATERSLLSSKLTLNDETLSNSKQATWMESSTAVDDQEEHFYESDPLYETPDSTWNRRCRPRKEGTTTMEEKRRQSGRQSSVSNQCYLIPHSAKLPRKGTGTQPGESLPEVTAPLGTAETSSRDHVVASSSSTKKSTQKHKKKQKKKQKASDENEVPGFEAPPLPSRNSPLTPEQATNDDHIYVNID